MAQTVLASARRSATRPPPLATGDSRQHTGIPCREAKAASMNVRIAHNLKLLAQHTAGGAPNLGEGMAMKIKDGRRYMYIAHERGPAAFSIFDVTEPSDPKMLYQLP